MTKSRRKHFLYFPHSARKMDRLLKKRRCRRAVQLDNFFNNCVGSQDVQDGVSTLNDGAHISNNSIHTDENASIQYEPTLDSDEQSHSEKAAENLDFQTLFGLKDQDHQTSGLSESDRLLMVLSFMLKHNLTNVGLADLVKMTNAQCGRDVLPNSLYLLLKPLTKNMSNFTVTYYCSTCEKTLNSTIESTSFVCDCQKRCSNFFVTCDMYDHLKTFLECTNLFQQRRYAENNYFATSQIRDVYHGQLYKNLVKNYNFSISSDFTYTVSCDGAPLSKSSNLQIWPMSIMLNEIHPSLRPRTLITAGFWVCNSQSEMSIQLLLERFCSIMAPLATDGIQWTNNDKRLRSRFFPLHFVADAPARAKLQNIISHSGFYSCNWCEHPGAYKNGAVRFPVGNNYPLRTKDSLRDCGNRAKKGKTILGVKGQTVLQNFSSFDVVKGMVPDYMHCVLLGVFRNLLELWLTVAHADWYIGNPKAKSDIDKKLLSTKTPSCLNRPPRSIGKWRHWKATELQNFMLHYLPLISGVLKAKYFDNAMMLRNSISVLLQRSISAEELMTCQFDIAKYVSNHQLLYGEGNMTYNVHVLLHLCDAVKECGPLWAFSAFPFENGLRLIHQHVTGYKVPAKQIAKRLMIARTVLTWPYYFSVSAQALEFSSSFVNVSFTYGSEEEFSPGVVVTSSDLSTNERLALPFNIDSELVYAHTKLKYKYFSITVKEGRNIDNSYFLLKDGTFGRIVRIFTYKLNNAKSSFLLLQHLVIKEYQCNGAYCQESDGNYVCLGLEDIVAPCVSVKLENGSFFVSNLLNALTC